jgi:hypothetical protein
MSMQMGPGAPEGAGRHVLTTDEAARGRHRSAERRNASRDVAASQRRAFLREDARLYAVYVDALEGGERDETVRQAREAWKEHARGLGDVLPARTRRRVS